MPFSEEFIEVLRKVRNNEITSFKCGDDFSWNDAEEVPEIGDGFDSHDSMVAFVQAFNFNTSISRLYIGSGHATFSGKMLVSLVNSIRIHESLETVDIHDVELDKDAAQAVGRFLAENKIIYDFALNFCIAQSDLDWVMIAEGIKKNKSLKALDLSKNKIGPIGLTAIATAVAYHPSLKKITLADDDNKREFEDVDLLKTVMWLISKNPSIEEIDLSASNGFGRKQVGAIVDAIKERNPNLNSLALHFNEENAGAVIDALEDDTSLYLEITFLSEGNKRAKSLVDRNKALGIAHKLFSQIQPIVPGQGSAGAAAGSATHDEDSKTDDHPSKRRRVGSHPSDLNKLTALEKKRAELEEEFLYDDLHNCLRVLVNLAHLLEKNSISPKAAIEALKTFSLGQRTLRLANQAMSVEGINPELKKELIRFYGDGLVGLRNSEDAPVPTSGGASGEAPPTRVQPTSRTSAGAAAGRAAGSGDERGV